MKWLLALFIMSIIGLTGTYSHVIELEEIIHEQTWTIFKLEVENRELIEKEDLWYKNQIEKWLPPISLVELPEKYTKRNDDWYYHPEKNK